MPEKELPTLICENPQETEKIFRLVANQKDISSDKVQVFKDKQIRFPYKPVYDFPPLVVLNVPEDVDANAFYIMKREKYKLQHQFTGYYCKVDARELSS